MRAEPLFSPELARVFNAAGMLAMVGMLLGAYVYQFSYRDVPCTLCHLQRVAMMAIAFGAAMNVRLGPDPRHYGVCLVSAVFGLAISVRQTFLHINPYFDTKAGAPTLLPMTNPPFGQPVMGLSLYVWGFALFAAVILAVGMVQFFRAQFRPSREPEWLSRLATISVGILFALALVETLTTFLECGFGHCPDDGGWHWWIFS